MAPKDETPEKTERFSVSRRDFLKSAGVTGLAATVIGMPKVEHLERNIAAAKALKPMPLEEMRRMSGELAPKNKLALERFFQSHVDA